VWGYGHYVIYASGAAVGAGLEVAVEQTVGKAHISTSAAAAAVTVPAALFVLTVWLLHARHFKRGLAQQLTLPVCGLAILAVPSRVTGRFSPPVWWPRRRSRSE
jgi:integral membrane sensor domain MASE1